MHEINLKKNNKLSELSIYCYRQNNAENTQSGTHHRITEQEKNHLIIYPTIIIGGKYFSIMYGVTYTASDRSGKLRSETETCAAGCA